MGLREDRDHHFQAAAMAFDCADRLQQLSRPVAQTAAVWLGKAATAAAMGDPASAVHDLERASAQLRRDARVSQKKIEQSGERGVVTETKVARNARPAALFSPWTCC